MTRGGLRFGIGALLLGVVVVACTGEGDDDVASPSPTPTPYFETTIVPIFYSQCGATSSACHSRAMYAADSGLNCTGFIALEDTALGAVFYSGSNAGLSTGCPNVGLYERLLMASAQCLPPEDSGRPYILPGVLASSYVFNKIAGGPYCLTTGGVPSAPMPFDHPIEPPQAIDTFRDWIINGALRQP